MPTDTLTSFARFDWVDNCCSDKAMRDPVMKVMFIALFVFIVPVTLLMAGAIILGIWGR